MARAKDVILQEYDKTHAREDAKEYAYKRLILEVLLEGVEALSDIRDHLAGEKPSEPLPTEKEAEKESPPADRPVQNKVEGQKYDPNGPPTSKQWWRLDEIQKQVSNNRWRQHLDDVSVSLETELTLAKASKIIDQVKKSNEKT